MDSVQFVSCFPIFLSFCFILLFFLFEIHAIGSGLRDVPRDSDSIELTVDDFDETFLETDSSGVSVFLVCLIFSPCRTGGNNLLDQDCECALRVAGDRRSVT